MTAYYNEIDPYAAEIAPGDVDERSMEEVNDALG